MFNKGIIMNEMKWKEGSPLIMSFSLGDIETPILRIVQDFIKTCLEQEPPKLALVYPHTLGDPLVDGRYWEGFRPEDPLTLRLYLNSFLPDDGTNMTYEITIADLIQEAFKRNPTPETMQTVYDALEKQMRVIKDYIADYKPPVDEEDE
jgi:hypothetical protein